MALDVNMTGGVKPPKKTPAGPDPFAAMGGGFQKDDGGWVPMDHPEAQAAMTPAPPPPTTAPAPTAGAPATTPAPAPATASQVQDVFRDSLVEQLSATADPFAAMGGGVRLPNGGWVPKDHPDAQQAGQPATVEGTGGIKAPPVSGDPFTAMGGGVQTPSGGWVPNNHPEAQSAAPAPVTPTPVTPAPAAPAPVTPAPVAANPQTPAAPTSNAIGDAFRTAVLAQLERGQQPVGDVENDPRAAAFRVAQRRNYDRDRAQAAESAAVNGFTGSGGFDGTVRGLNQQRAEAEAGYEAGLVGEQMAERRAELMNAMAMASALGDRESAADLQRELATLDATVRREGYDVSRREQDIDAALQREGFGVTQRGQDIQRFGIQTSADLDRADQVLRRYGLDLNDKQTAQRLGFDYAQLQELANRQAVLAALG